MNLQAMQKKAVLYSFFSNLYNLQLYDFFVIIQPLYNFNFDPFWPAPPQHMFYKMQKKHTVFPTEKNLKKAGWLTIIK